MSEVADVTGLLRRWCAVVPAATTHAAVVSAGRALLRRWGEPHRHHHTAEHLAAVLDVVETNAAQVADAGAVALAAWFHDAVYDPRATDNEECSAMLAASVLEQLGGDPVTVAEVARLVRLTATHHPPPGDTNAALLVDADLAILAAAPERYDRYAERIRWEYGHLDEATYGAGRIAVLLRLVGDPVIYHLVGDRAVMRRQAQANMLREIDRLGRPAERIPRRDA